MGARRDFERALSPALRRVDGVRLLMGDGTVRAEVYGIGNRLPARVSVGVKLAARLVEAGAPLRVERSERGRPASAPSDLSGLQPPQTAGAGAGNRRESQP